MKILVALVASAMLALTVWSGVHAQGVRPVADLADDAPLPKGLPVDALVVFCKKQVDTRTIILFMEATYADGTVVRFDGTHSHGFTDTTQLYHLMQHASQFRKKIIDCQLPGPGTQA